MRAWVSSGSMFSLESVVVVSREDMAVIRPAMCRKRKVFLDLGVFGSSRRFVETLLAGWLPCPA